MKTTSRLTRAFLHANGLGSMSRQFCDTTFETRMIRKAKVVDYVCQTLGESFDCVSSIEKAACTMAVTKDNKNFLPINIRSAIPRKRKIMKFHFHVAYRENCIQILGGLVPLSEEILLWHFDRTEMEKIKLQQAASCIGITLGHQSDISRRIGNLTAAIERYWADASLLVSYDQIMRKQGEDTNDRIQLGKYSETFTKRLLEKVGYIVTFPNVDQVTADLIVHVDGIPLVVQVKCSSHTSIRYTKNSYKISCFRRRSSIGVQPFRDLDSDVYIICVQTSSNTIDYIYCVPVSVMVTLGIVSSADVGTMGKTTFYVLPEADGGCSKSKYLRLNKYKIDVRNMSRENMPKIAAQLHYLLGIAVKEKSLKFKYS